MDGTFSGKRNTQDDRGHDHVLIRTRLAWSPTRGEYVTERYFIREWPKSEEDASDLPAANERPSRETGKSSRLLYLLSTQNATLLTTCGHVVPFGQSSSRTLGLPKEAIEEIVSRVERP